MKLKKIASLMLAGVMAVSMLAGCAGKGETKPEEPATGVNATTVIAALGKDFTKNVTFSASSELQTVADKAAGYVNDGIVNKFNLALLNKIDADILATQDYLDEVKTGSRDNTAATDMKTQTATFIVKSNMFGASDSATVKNLVDAIEKQAVAVSNLHLNELPAESKEYTDSNTKEAYKFTFAYAVDMAVTSTHNSDGQTTYYAVYTITRTPTRVAVEA